MAPPPRPLERLALRALDSVDHACNRLYGWRWNPLYQSGAIAVALLAVLIATGLWLLLFYRVGAPYASVARITADPWVGRWARGVHRFASDWVLVAAGVHAFRMFAQGRSWGPRVLAWASGVVITGLVYFCGLTGYVMVWDTFGQAVAKEGARVIDSLPILSEPISRAFAGEVSLLGPFFFLTLFAHIAVPLGIALVLWLHVSRVARPALLPPRRVTVTLVGLLVGAAILWPLGMQPEATAFHLPESVEVDVFYAFWLPLVRPLSGGVALSLLALTGVALLLVPAFTRRRGEAAPAPSFVDESVCTGCTQCSLDCPFDAITMIAREPAGGRSLEVARVDPDRCVSCGICAGSCAPMAVGPPTRTGREQLAALRQRVEAGVPYPGAVTVVCCERSARGWGESLADAGAVLHPVDCAGSVHTSVIELLVRGGAAGVLVLSCPPRDCWSREGPKWTVDRMYHDREAELKPRVDRRRVRLASAAAADGAGALRELAAFRASLPTVAPTAVAILELDTECETAAAGEGA